MKFLAAAVALLGACRVQAAAVFAHFMVSNAQNYSLARWQDDIGMAQAAHIDAFALNIAYGDAGNLDSLNLAFQAAQSKGFQLFLSFDYAGGGPWPADKVRSLAKSFIGLGTYYKYNGKPMISTFEGTESAHDWVQLKTDLDCFFIPDWSSLGADKAMQLGVADGLFSWAAWAWGNQPMDTYIDASYRYYLKGKPYMMPASPWFYTNLPYWDKNWLWRGDDAWYDRWTQILWWKPEFVEIISWNDYGESHYIGPIYDDAMGLFTKGKASYNYAAGMPHDGWRFILPFVIDMYKKGTATVTQEGVVGWYRLSPAAACNSGYTSGNTASQLQVEFQPADVVEDAIFYTAVLGSYADVRVSVGGVSLPAQWTRTPPGGVGLYHGSINFAGHTGNVVVSVVRNGGTVATMNGASISTSCPNSLTNWNAWVGVGTGGSVSSAATPMSKLVCTDATGAGNFQGLCGFACNWGTYCPWEACVCRGLGTVPGTEPLANHPEGFPLAGLSESYKGLCSYDCTHGYCPPSACSTVSAPLSTPTVSPFEPLACTGGTGEGNLAGLCGYSCGYGFCPVVACKCTARGPVPAQPPATTTIRGVPAAGLSKPTYSALCSYACEHGYCPDGACTSTTVIPTPPNGVVTPPVQTGVCALEWSSGDPATDSATWHNSGAADWFYDFLLHQYPLTAWPNDFFKKVLGTAGTTIDCINYDAPGCEAPAATACGSYNPPEAFFVHLSMSNLYKSLLGFHSDLSDMVDQALTGAIADISATFAEPDPAAEMVLSILSGVIATIAGASLTMSHFGVESLAVLGDSLSVMAAFFTDLSLTPKGDTPRDVLTELLGDAIVSLKADMIDVAKGIFTPPTPPTRVPVNAAVEYISGVFANGAWLDNRVFGKAMQVYSASVQNTLWEFLVITAMKSSQRDTFALLYGHNNQWNTKEACDERGDMGTWYDNTCLMFGVVHRASGGRNGVVTWTTFPSDDEVEGIRKYVQSPSLALINNWECHKSKGDAGEPDFDGLKFDPQNPVIYPPCFWNLGAIPIKPQQ